MATWVFKTEPGDYSWADLVREKRAVWTGVRNPAAQKNLRSIAEGDTIVIYHTGDEKSAVGVARAVSDAYADPGDATKAVVDVAPVRALARPVALSEFRADPVLGKTELVRLPRLSVSQLTAPQLARLEKLAK